MSYFPECKSHMNTLQKKRDSADKYKNGKLPRKWRLRDSELSELDFPQDTSIWLKSLESKFFGEKNNFYENSNIIIWGSYYISRGFWNSWEVFTNTTEEVLCFQI